MCDENIVTTLQSGYNGTLVKVSSDRGVLIGTMAGQIVALGTAISTDPNVRLEAFYRDTFKPRADALLKLATSKMLVNVEAYRLVSRQLLDYRFFLVHGTNSPVMDFDTTARFYENTMGTIKTPLFQSILTNYGLDINSLKLDRLIRTMKAEGGNATVDRIVDNFNCKVKRVKDGLPNVIISDDIIAEYTSFYFAQALAYTLDLPTGDVAIDTHYNVTLLAGVTRIVSEANEHQHLNVEYVLETVASLYKLRVLTCYSPEMISWGLLKSAYTSDYIYPAKYTEVLSNNEPENLYDFASSAVAGVAKAREDSLNRGVLHTLGSALGVSVESLDYRNTFSGAVLPELTEDELDINSLESLLVDHAKLTKILDEGFEKPLSKANSIALENILLRHHGKVVSTEGIIGTSILVIILGSIIAFIIKVIRIYRAIKKGFSLHNNLWKETETLAKEITMSAPAEKTIDLSGHNLSTVINLFSKANTLLEKYGLPPSVNGIYNFDPITVARSVLEVNTSIKKAMSDNSFGLNILRAYSEPKYVEKQMSDLTTIHANLKSRISILLDPSYLETCVRAARNSLPSVIGDAMVRLYGNEVFEVVPIAVSGRAFSDLQQNAIKLYIGTDDRGPKSLEGYEKDLSKLKSNASGYNATITSMLPEMDQAGVTRIVNTVTSHIKEQVNIVSADIALLTRVISAHTVSETNIKQYMTDDLPFLFSIASGELKGL